MIATFAYHRSLSPMVGVLLGIALVEAAVVHVVAVAMWGWHVAAVLSVIDVGAAGTLFGLLRSFRQRPVILADDRLTLRAGSLKSITLDVADIAGFRLRFDAADLKRRKVLNLALIAWPNVVLELSRPVGRRGYMAVAHRLDDPAAFRAALGALGIR